MTPEEIAARLRPRPRRVPAHLRRAGAVERRAGLDGERPLARGPGGAVAPPHLRHAAAARRSSRGPEGGSSARSRSRRRCPTLDETLAWPRAARRRGPAVASSATAVRGTEVHTIHTEVEGRSKAELFARILDDWIAGRRRVRPALGAGARGARAARPGPRARLAKTRLPGRGGFVTTGWPEPPAAVARSRMREAADPLRRGVARRPRRSRGASASVRRKLRRRVLRHGRGDPPPGRRLLPRDRPGTTTRPSGPTSSRRSRSWRSGSAARSARPSAPFCSAWTS